MFYGDSRHSGYNCGTGVATVAQGTEEGVENYKSQNTRWSAGRLSLVEMVE